MINPVVLNAPPVDDHIRLLKRLDDPIKPDSGSQMLRSRASTILKSHQLDKSFRPELNPAVQETSPQEASINASCTVENSEKSSADSPTKLILKENLSLLRSNDEPNDVAESSFFRKFGQFLQSLKNIKKVFFYGQISHSN